MNDLLTQLPLCRAAGAVFYKNGLTVAVVHRSSGHKTEPTPAKLYNGYVDAAHERTGERRKPVPALRFRKAKRPYKRNTNFRRNRKRRPVVAVQKTATGESVFGMETDRPSAREKRFGNRTDRIKNTPAFESAEASPPYLLVQRSWFPTRAEKHTIIVRSRFLRLFVTQKTADSRKGSFCGQSLPKEKRQIVACPLSLLRQEQYAENGGLYKGGRVLYRRYRWLRSG